MADFTKGQKVRDTKTGKFYDFGYVSQTGLAVVYEEGECNMQDSVGIPLGELETVEYGNRCCGTCTWWCKDGRYSAIKCRVPLPA